MRAKYLYGAWLLFRHLAVAGLVIIGFPFFIATCCAVASVAGGHTNGEKGDLAMTIPFAGTAFLIACLFTSLMLFPAMLVSDAFRLVKNRRRLATLLPGLVTVFLSYLPWQVSAARTCSLKWLLIGVAFVASVFTVYWGVCQGIDLLAEKVVTYVGRKLKSQV